jgi:hypothetical protein
MKQSERVELYEIAKGLNVKKLGLKESQLIAHIDAMRRRILALLPAMSRTRWYIKQQSQRRRDQSKSTQKCIYCEKEDVTAGFHGPKQRRYSSCEGCREERRLLMRRIREKAKLKESSDVIDAEVSLIKADTANVFQVNEY